jgi:hypothetical protein
MTKRTTEMNDLLIYWVNWQTSNEKSFEMECYFVIQCVDSIEQIGDGCFKIIGYSLKRVEDDKIRLIRQTVPKAILVDGKFYAQKDDDGRFAFAEMIWENDTDVEL